MLPSDWETEQQMADRLLATGQAMTETEMVERLGLEPLTGVGLEPATMA